VIESALFIVAFDESSPRTVEQLSHAAMHRHGKALWFDKNFTMIVFQNGRMASNVDHSWGEAGALRCALSPLEVTMRCTDVECVNSL